MKPNFNSTGGIKDYGIALLLVIITAIACYFSEPLIGYKAVALILLLLVSLIAMIFRLGPVILAAASSALIWDFFFIPPTFTFTVGSVDDSLFLLMYFVIALISGVSTSKFRQLEKKETERIEQENAIKLYNTLFNSLSHELQTPLATIIGATDTIKEGKLAVNQQEVLISSISEAALRLNAQVEGLLNISRMEAGFLKTKPDWTDLNELIYNPINQISIEAERIKITIQENPPLIKLDQHLIEQVIYNLVNNAVLHTPTTTVIKINAELTPANLLHIVISDNGKGFPENERSKAFDKFYQLENTSHKGNGLGLSIAKGFVEAHGGNITLCESPEGGAEFRITIPVEVSNFNKEDYE